MKAINKDFFRELKKNKGRFISVFFIVMLGAAFYAGIRANKGDMLKSADYYYDKVNFKDIEVIGTKGLTKKDISAIKKVDGIGRVSGNYSMDVLSLSDDTEQVVKLIALNDDFNKPTVLEGRLPKTEKECFVDSKFFRHSTYKIGDEVTFISGTDDDLDESLKYDTYKIVGVGNLPQYMQNDRGYSTIGDGNIDSFVVVKPQVFKLEAYTNIYAQIKGVKGLNTYSDDYKEISENIKSRIKKISSEESKRRYDEICKTAYEELDDAKDKIKDAKKELKNAKKKIKDGEKKLKDAKNTLKDKENELKKVKKTLSSKKQELNSGKKKLQQKEKELKAGKKQLEEKRKELQKGKEELEKNRDDYDEAVQGYKKLSDALVMVPKESVEYKALSTQIDTLNAAMTKFEVSELTISKGENELKKAENKIKSGETSLNKAKKKIKDGEKQIKSAEKKIADGKSQLKKGKDEIKDKEKELKKAKKKYEKESKKANKKIKKAEKKIADGEKEIKKLEVPKWYVLNREDEYSCSSYEDAAISVDNIGDIFPIIFFLIAALVSLTAMTRMVEEQRQQIGTLKSLGYGNKVIFKRYLSFALIPTILGSCIGVIIGQKLFPYIIMTTYEMVFEGLHEYVTPIDLKYAFIAVGLNIGCVGTATYLACKKVVRTKTAELMRPKAPKRGKRVIVEKLFIWKKLNFTLKATIRNLFRYKKRFFMTLMGIGGCMSLIIVALGLNESVSSLGQKQYREIQRYDATVAIEDKISKENKDKLLAFIKDYEQVDNFMEIYTITTDMKKSEDSKTDSVSIVVPQSIKDIDNYYCFRDRITREEYDYPTEGALLTEKIAKDFGIKVNDTIYVSIDGEYRKIKVANIVENYIDNYVYITKNTYKKLTGKDVKYNQILIVCNDKADMMPSYTEEFGKELIEKDGVEAAVFMKESVESFDDMMKSLSKVVNVLLISAGLLAAVVIYNLNNINIAEREMELATLKVLGFYDGEVATYVYRENLILTLLGIIVGLFMGKWLHNYIMASVEMKGVMFGDEISIMSFLTSAALTVLFAIVVNAMMYGGLKKIDMLKSLKCVE